MAEIMIVTRVTREELYALVWSEPMSLLARKFGLSDVGLAKMCRRAAIPVPQRGYWAKRQAGRQVEPLPLPPRQLGASGYVDMQGSNWQEHHRGEDINESAAIGPPVFPESPTNLVERVQSLVGRVAVPKTLAGAHHLIAELLNKDEVRREKQQTDRYASIFDAPIFDSPFERRRLRILNAIFHALHRCGMRPSVRGQDARELGVRVGQSYLSFTLDRVAGQRRAFRVTDSSSKANASDKLLLKIETSGNLASQTSWEDGEKSIEDQVRDIVVALIVAGEMQYREGERRAYEWEIERREKLREEARRRKDEEERRERDRRLKAAKDRLDRLLGDVEAFHRAGQIRAYVKAALARNASLNVPEEELKAWVAWALAQADDMDPVVSGQFVGPISDHDPD